MFIFISSAFKYFYILSNEFKKATNIKQETILKKQFLKSSLSF